MSATMRKFLTILTLALAPLSLGATELEEPFDGKFLNENKVIDVVVSHRFDARGVAEKANVPLTTEECEKKAEDQGEDPKKAYVFEFLENVSPGSQALLVNLTGKKFKLRMVQLCLVRKSN